MSKKKSTAKANGLKSSFLLADGRVLMTSFGPGAAAVREKEIDGTDIRELATPPSFTVSTAGETAPFDVRGRIGKVTAVNRPDGVNALRAKNKIEEIFFGKGFDDNLHIQLAYNIMDIQKLILEYSSMAVHSVNNMDRFRSNSDFLGVFKTQQSYKMTRAVYYAREYGLIGYQFPNGGFFIDRDVWRSYGKNELSFFGEEASRLNLDSPNRDIKVISQVLVAHGIRMRNILDSVADNYTAFTKFFSGAKKTAYYFGNAFVPTAPFSEEEWAFELLRVLGIFRQSSMHGKKIEHNLLFTLDENPDIHLRELLGGLLCNRVEEINSHFLKNNKVNLAILKEVCPDAENRAPVQAYYDFSVLKTFKNLGFSIRKLRENMLSFDETAKLSEKYYDSVRAKLYSLFDFILYNYFLQNTESARGLVEELRASADEESKAKVYMDHAKTVWKYIRRDIMEKVVPRMNADAVKELRRHNPETGAAHLKVVDPNSISLFAKAVYCLCGFLDGKEINMFLGGLINKLENISGFLDIGITTDFKDGFKLFDDSKKKAEELRFIQSIARMNKGKKAMKDSKLTIKECQYLDSAAVFGETDENRVRTEYCLNSNSKYGDKSLRNFMINNVINNNRFLYVVRFINPRDARKLMENKPLLMHFLREIPESQLERYCRTACLRNCAAQSREKKTETLSELLREVRFDNFLKVRQKARTKEEILEKERCKSLITLYLTVLYLAIKTILRINTRYAIAFGILERDLEIYDKATNNYNGLTEIFEKNGWLNKRVKKSINGPNSCYSDALFKAYRNSVSHLNAIMDFPDFSKNIVRVKSMFDVYHCVLLSNILKNSFVRDSCPFDAGTALENALKYNTAWKDYLNSIHSPFAYNAPRFVNLTNRDCFMESFGK